MSQVFSVILNIIQRSCSGFVVRSDTRPRWSGKAESDGNITPRPCYVYHSLWVQPCGINEIKTRLREVAMSPTEASDIV